MAFSIANVIHPNVLSFVLPSSEHLCLEAEQTKKHQFKHLVSRNGYDSNMKLERFSGSCEILERSRVARHMGRSIFSDMLVWYSVLDFFALHSSFDVHIE